MSKFKIEVEIKSGSFFDSPAFSFPYVMNIWATSETIANDIPVCQAILEFIYRYQSIIGINIGAIDVELNSNNYSTLTKWENKKQYKVFANIGFLPKNNTSVLYYTTGLDNKTNSINNIKLEDLTVDKFSNILLDCYEDFVYKLLESWSKKITKQTYPCTHVKIDGVEGVLIDGYKNYNTRGLIYKLISQNEYTIYNVKRDEIGNPISLEKGLFKNRYGWFVPLKDSNDIFKKKKSIKLNNKNFKILNRDTDMRNLIQ